MTAALWWVLWVAVVVVLAWKALRALDEPLDRDRLAAAAHTKTEHLIGTGPDPDAEPGFDIPLQDECELIWSIPVVDEAGLDRLRAAIRDEQQEGGTS